MSRGRLGKEFSKPWFALELFLDIRPVVVIATCVMCARIDVAEHRETLVRV